MATRHDFEVDLTPISTSSESLYSSPCYDVEFVQPDVTIQAVPIADQGPQAEATTIEVGPQQPEPLSIIPSRIA
jgi:hypothetical protein